MMRVLVVRLSAMGDVVQSLAAVQTMLFERPELQCTWVVQAASAPLLAGLPLQVVEHDRRGGLRALRATAARLRELRCDVALDLQGNWKSALLARLSGARRRIGMAGPWRQEPWSRMLLTETVASAGPRHPGRCAAAVVGRLLGGAVVGTPRLQATAAELAREHAALRELGIDPSRPFRVLLLGDPADNRVQRPASAAREVAESPVPAVWLVGPFERNVSLPAPAPRLQHGPGECRRLIALGALVARAGGDVVGHDSGPVHVLAAGGATVRVLFGAQDPAATAAPTAIVRRHPQPPECMPCRSRRCTHRDGPVCMEFTARDGAAVQ